MAHEKCQQEVQQGGFRLICIDSCHYDYKLSLANKKTPGEQSKVALIKEAFLCFDQSAWNSGNQSGNNSVNKEDGGLIKTIKPLVATIA